MPFPNQQKRARKLLQRRDPQPAEIPISCWHHLHLATVTHKYWRLGKSLMQNSQKAQGVCKKCHAEMPTISQSKKHYKTPHWSIDSSGIKDPQSPQNVIITKQTDPSLAETNQLNIVLTITMVLLSAIPHKRKIPVRSRNPQREAYLWGRFCNTSNPLSESRFQIGQQAVGHQNTSMRSAHKKFTIVCIHRVFIL